VQTHTVQPPGGTLTPVALVTSGTGGGSDNTGNGGGGGGGLSIPLGVSVPDERGTRFMPNLVLLAAVVLTGTARVIRAARS
jgi:hypothetical protein